MTDTETIQHKHRAMSEYREAIASAQINAAKLATDMHRVRAAASAVQPFSDLHVPAAEWEGHPPIAEWASQVEIIIGHIKAKGA